MPSAVKSAEQHALGFTKRQRTIALVVVSLAFVMDLLDSTIVNIAIPSIQHNLGASYATIQWLVAGYSLAFALLLITGGRMGDVYGYKKLFMVGVAGFTVASFLSGVAWSPTALIVARLLQGSMAALMVPQVISLMQIMYKPEERGAINGLFGGLGGLAATLGPIIGGLLIKANLFNLDWRPIFLINVPIGIFGLLMAMKYLPDGKSPHPLKLDIRGTVIVMVALTLLVYPLIQGRELGWPLWSFIMMAASLPVFALFAWWQKRKMALDGSPLVLPALFKVRSFPVGLLVNMTFEAVMLGFFLTYGLVLQIGFGFTPLHAAVTGIPLAVGIALTMATMGEKVIPKLGRVALNIGLIVMGLGLVVITATMRHYGLDTHSWQLIPGLFLVGVGMGFTFGTLFAIVLNDVDTQHAGSASGILNAAQQVGGAVGIAIIGVIFFGQLNHGAVTSFNSIKPQLASELTAQHVPATAQAGIISGVQNCFVDRSQEKDSSVVPASCQHANNDPALAQAITQDVSQANSTNFTHSLKWGTVYEILLLLFLTGISFLLPRHFRPEAFSEAM